MRNAASGSKSKLKRTMTKQQAAAGAGDVKAKKAACGGLMKGIPDAVLLETCDKLLPFLEAKRENEKIIEKAKAEIKRLEASTLELMRSHLANNKTDNVYLDCTANVAQVGAGLPQNALHADTVQSPKSQSSGSDGEWDGGPECGATEEEEEEEEEEEGGDVNVSPLQVEEQPEVFVERSVYKRRLIATGGKIMYYDYRRLV
ncbi:uncharacterized protein LOC125425574 [Sphaerodactylus townsendi]|uniref:uncharacterized protein LOC125425574 n=1 Tax=Sphaerodactylus townsendi TaxID=933632 RepID=UPI002025EFA7|nr:uncharacterized protein LOC125425574 [Sphaerodactylus townsendi]